MERKMDNIQQTQAKLVEYADRLKSYKALSANKPDDFFAPDISEYIDKYDGAYNADKTRFSLCFEVKGTRYEERTYNIEHINQGDPLIIERDSGNAYNTNNFVVLNNRHENIGVLPAELCNILAPLYDVGSLKIVAASVGYVDHILERSRYATKSVVFCGLSVSLG